MITHHPPQTPQQQTRPYQHHHHNTASPESPYNHPDQHQLPLPSHQTMMKMRVIQTHLTTNNHHLPLSHLPLHHYTTNPQNTSTNTIHLNTIHLTPQQQKCKANRGSTHTTHPQPPLCATEQPQGKATATDKPYPSSTKLHHHRQSNNKGKTPQPSHLIPHRLPQSQTTVQQQQKLQLTTTMPIIKAGRIRSLNHTAESYQDKSPQPSPTQQTQCKATEPGTRS